MPDVRSMCAIGQRGQLGLEGRLPWEGASGAEYVADVQRFFELTREHVLIAGPRTIASIPPFAFEETVRPTAGSTPRGSWLLTARGCWGRSLRGKPLRSPGTGFLYSRKPHEAGRPL